MTILKTTQDLKSTQDPGALSGSAAEAAQAAIEAGLLYVSDAEPGFRRVRAGKGFRYLTVDHCRLEEQEHLRRIASLAIPPAYTDVWISTQPRGHLQATGRDARGRKQYRYHPDWRQARDSAKFERMVAFGEALHRLRQRLKRDLALAGLPREKVLALVITLLDATRVRVGNSEYARDNKSFGLTTLRDRHVKFIRDGRAVLNFKGKGGIHHEVLINDKRIVQIVRRCHELPGQSLFQYVNDDGQRCPIDSGQVNEYLKEAMGDDFTAKDFRTWGATLHAITLLACTPLPTKPSERAFKKHILEVVKQVAAKLRNTPAVCRKSYISPAVFDTWRSGRIHAAFNGSLSLAAPRRAETLVLQFLRAEAKRPVKKAARAQRGRPLRHSPVGGRRRSASAQRYRHEQAAIAALNQ